MRCLRTYAFCRDQHMYDAMHRNVHTLCHPDDIAADQTTAHLWSSSCRYDDAYAHQNVFGPLVKIEADYDKARRESQSKHDITIRWDTALNKKALARFVFTRDDSPELRLIPGDIRCSRAAAQAPCRGQPCLNDAFLAWSLKVF